MSERVREWCEKCQGGVRPIPRVLAHRCGHCGGIGYTIRAIPSAELAEIGRLSALAGATKTRKARFWRDVACDVYNAKHPPSSEVASPRPPM